MMALFLIRHCKALGQVPEAELTSEGFAQALRLRDLLLAHDIKKVISSPYVRALQTIEPYCKRKNVPITSDIRLRERVLATVPLDDWIAALEQTFINSQLHFEGGESSETAFQRVFPLIEEVMKYEGDIALVTHGNLMALILRHFIPKFGFDEWRSLSNPDVYKISVSEASVQAERLWTDI